MDVRRRSRGAQRAQGQPREAGRQVERHAGGRRRRRSRDDRGACPRHRGQPADRRADARLRHHRLGQAGRGRRPERDRREGRLGQDGAGRAAEVLQVQRQVDRRAGQHSLDQLDLGQQGGAREGRRHHRAEELRRVHRRGREGAEGRLHCHRPRRPTLAGSDRLRQRRARHRRARLLPQGVHRPRCEGARLADHGEGIPAHGSDSQAGRQGLLRARLERRLRHGDQRQGRLPDHGRLGQGRVHQRQEGAGQGLPLLSLPGHAGQRVFQLPTSS